MLWLNQENYHNFYVQDVDIFCNQNGGKENDDDADADDDDDDDDDYKDDYNDDGDDWWKLP